MSYIKTKPCVVIGQISVKSRKMVRLPNAWCNISCKHMLTINGFLILLKIELIIVTIYTH